jgi:APA family basic amino acid/polyamine antiporter
MRLDMVAKARTTCYRANAAAMARLFVESSIDMHVGSTRLAREVGFPGAVMLGLGSMLGTGVFVSVGLAAGIAGAGVLPAIALAAGVAACNALSSAQLAANHPVSGGTYEYGYKYLTPWLGFSAGWMFLCAKTASAASAALGCAGYLLSVSGRDADWLPFAAVAVAAAVTLVVLAGVKQSNRVNAAIVTVTLVALAAFVLAGSGQVRTENLRISLEPRPLLHAAALMFVAFTGYGRIATLGEEVIEPHRTIPRAIIATVAIAAALYLAVAAVAVGSLGGEALGASTAANGAPLESAAREFAVRIEPLVALGAMTAMLGVLLNLVLGLSRVLLAMGRRGDMPAVCTSVRASVLFAGMAVGLLAALGDLQRAWSFSAFTVLVYYAVTNLAALRLGQGERLYGAIIARIGLVACASLAFAVDAAAWLTGLGMLGAGLGWHAWRRRTA